jgi:hypothetical protein
VGDEISQEREKELTLWLGIQLYPSSIGAPSRASEHQRSQLHYQLETPVYQSGSHPETELTEMVCDFNEGTTPSGAKKGI